MRLLDLSAGLLVVVLALGAGCDGDDEGDGDSPPLMPLQFGRSPFSGA